MALAYIKIEDPQIDGDSKEQNHQNWIPVDEIGYGIQWDGDVKAADAAGRLNGEPNHSGLTITKPIDKSSPMLRQKCSSGERLGKVTVDLVNLAGTGVVAHQIELAPAFVSGIRIVTPPDNGSQPVEEVEFRYGTVKWVHTSQDDKGKKAGQSEGSWNIREHKPLS